jgi:predicted NAD-dependent protein-ADP-ribosyltransferase YbiA (DUF1768 family)
MTILFYNADDPYGCFSNFSRHPVKVYGTTWKTSEAAFQAMKFWPHRPDLVKRVWEAPTPAATTRLGRDRSFPLRKDWDSAPPEELRARVPQRCAVDDQVSRQGVSAEPIFARTKDVFMYEICHAKFSNHPELRSTLVGTFPQPLVEDALHDPYWGWGCSRNGQNKLGRILMLVRMQLLKESHG